MILQERTMNRATMCVSGSIAFAASLAGCAGYTVQAMKPDGSGKNGPSGYTVYEPKPYILRTPILDDKAVLKGYQFSVVYLPNYSKPYRVRSYNFLAKSDIQFTFKDGWMLTNVADKSDNTTITSDLIKAAQALLPGVLDRNLPGPQDPVLYEIEFSPVDGHIQSLRAVGPSYVREKTSGAPADSPSSADGSTQR
jgi:hypothetical protein